MAERERTVLALGDSITDGGTKERSYRYLLHGLLARAGHRVRWAGSLAGVYDRPPSEAGAAGATIEAATLRIPNVLGEGE